MTILDFSIVPLKEGESISEDVAEALIEVKKSGLKYQLRDMGTTIEGDTQECLNVVSKTMDKITKANDRVYCVVKMDYSADKEKRLGEATAKVERLVNETVKGK